MVMELAAGMAVVVPIAGGFVYVLNLKGRLDTVDARFDGLKELINERFDHQGLRLERIERAMNGALKEHLHE